MLLSKELAATIQASEAAARAVGQGEVIPAPSARVCCCPLPTLAPHAPPLPALSLSHTHTLSLPLPLPPPFLSSLPFYPSPICACYVHSTHPSDTLRFAGSRGAVEQAALINETQQLLAKRLAGNVQRQVCAFSLARHSWCKAGSLFFFWSLARLGTPT